MGGLSRRAYVIKKYLNGANNPPLILDAGALLFDVPVLPPSQASGKKEQAEGIMQAIRSMQYNAIGIAPQDLSGGIDFLEHLLKTYTIPFISANLIRRDNGSTVFKPFIIQQVDDISIAVLGLTGNFSGTQNKELLKNVSILPWQEVLQEILASLGNSADMIILLSSYPEQTNRQIAQQFNEINLILQSGHSKANRPPQLFGNSLITQTAGRGKYAGRMDINWTTAKKWHQNSAPSLKTTQDRVDRVSWRLGRLDKKYQGESLEENVQYQKLQKEKSRLLEEIEKLKKRQQQAPPPPSTYSYRAIALKTALPQDPEVESIIAVTKKRVYEINKKRVVELKQKTKNDNTPTFMAGWRSCRSCHLKQTDFWQQTRHAKAWDSLAQDKQQFNQDCLICHVTLPTYNKEAIIRDNLLAALTSEFHGVSCEACHGPAKMHVQQPEQIKPRKPSVQTCLVCHTAERDDNFDFTEKIKIIRCPAL